MQAIPTHMSDASQARPAWRANLEKLLEEKLGHDLKTGRIAEVEEALQQIAFDCGYQWADDYVREVSELPIESPLVQAMVRLATNKESYFFRDPITMLSLRDTILPALLESARPQKRFRVWSAGCSTGEEVYSIGILLREVLGEEWPDWTITLVATDIDESAIATARAAEYGMWSLRAMSEEAREKYFVLDPRARRHRIRSEHRASVGFGLHNLADEHARVPHPGLFDLILCRNVSIYFTERARNILAKKLFGALAPHGAWIGGPSDPLPGGDAHVRILPGLIQLRHAAARTPVLGMAPVSDRIEREPEAPPCAVARAPDRPPSHRTPPPVDVRAVRDWMSEAELRADRGDHTGALEALNEASAAGSLSPRVYGLRAIIEESAGLPERALESYRRALYLDPTAADVHARLGLLLHRLDRQSEAVKALRNAVVIGAKRELLAPGEVDPLSSAAARVLARLVAEKRHGSR